MNKIKKLYVIHLGIGNVGNAVVTQIEQQSKTVKEIFGVEIFYQKKFTTNNTKEEIMDAIQTVPSPFVVIDTTASDQTLPLLQHALTRGGFVVLANKKPLAGSQKDFDELHKLGGERLFYECVVGAGLPVIRPLKDFLATGDEIVEIQGCFSGTLGYLFSQLDKGTNFSDAVIKAKQLGFTEPDPRDDLGGVDVARKALILARLIGEKIELKDIKLEGLYPKKMDRLSRDDFLNEIKTLDTEYKKRIANAQKKNMVLRFVAKIDKKSCSVGLQEVDRASDIGSLNGPDNIVVMKTRRYAANPLVVKGPGAGIEVTAAGVFADVINILKMI